MHASREVHNIQKVIENIFRNTHTHSIMILFSCSWIILSHFIASAIAASTYTMSSDTCSKYDTCYLKSGNLETCRCDANCHVYGTCCVDIQDNQKTPAESFRCYGRMFTPVFVKRSCAEDFRGDAGIVDACLDEDEDEMDFKNNFPVASYTTEILYWNSYCAACNHEAAHDLAFWDIQVACPNHKNVTVTRNLIRRNFTFDQEKNQWGLQIDDEFLQCIVKYAVPHSVEEVQFCTKNLVSRCLSNYTDEEIIRKCSEYYAERRMPDPLTYYKNVHCAICNYADITKLDCPGMPLPRVFVEQYDFRGMVTETFTKYELFADKEYQWSKKVAHDSAHETCECRHKKPPVTIYNSSNAYKEGNLRIIAVLFAFLALLK